MTGDVGAAGLRSAGRQDLVIGPADIQAVDIEDRAKSRLATRFARGQWPDAAETVTSGRRFAELTSGGQAKCLEESTSG